MRETEKKMNEFREEKGNQRLAQQVHILQISKSEIRGSRYSKSRGFSERNAYSKYEFVQTEKGKYKQATELEREARKQPVHSRIFEGEP